MTRRALNLHPAPVLLHNPMHSGQAKADAPVPALRREKGLEKPLHDGGVHPAAGVLEAYAAEGSLPPVTLGCRGQGGVIDAGDPSLPVH